MSHKEQDSRSTGAISVHFFGTRWNGDWRKIALSVPAVTRAISHGFKQRFNFYRGPDCKTAERGCRACLASRLRQRGILSLSFVKLFCRRRTDRTREPKERTEGETEIIYQCTARYSRSIESDCIRSIRSTIGNVGISRHRSVSGRLKLAPSGAITPCNSYCPIIRRCEVSEKGTPVNATELTDETEGSPAQTAVFYAFCAFKKNPKRKSRLERERDGERKGEERSRPREVAAGRETARRRLAGGENAGGGPSLGSLLPRDISRRAARRRMCWLEKPAAGYGPSTFARKEKASVEETRKKCAVCRWLRRRFPSAKASPHCRFRSYENAWGLGTRHKSRF